MDTLTDFPFTQSDTPETRARIERDLRLIAQRARQADRHLSALVLTGGFSRGEGTVRDGAPVNDYDLVAVRSQPGGRSRYAALHEELSQLVGLEVDLMPIWRARIPHVAPKLFWHDLRLGGKVVWGDAGVLDELPHYKARDIPAQEVARLLGNRAAGLLEAVPGVGEPVDEHERQLQATKAVLAALDARLLSQGRYAATLRGRLGQGRELGLVDQDAFELAVAWKLSVDGLDPGTDWWPRARDVLLRAVDDTGARHVRDGAVEHAYHLVAGRRWRTSPSQAVRGAAWDLLRVTEHPDGPAQPERARVLLARLGRADAQDWPTMKRRFFELRAQTLQ